MDTLHDSERILYEKLLKVAKAIAFIEKRGHNKHHHYDFVQAADVTREVRDKLFEANVIVLPSARNASHLPYGSKGGHLTTIDLRYRFVDTETGASTEIDWVGAGVDIAGDKGIYKAMTGGLKYALMNTFLIPSTSDPEADNFSQAEGQEQAPVQHKDDSRPAAPTIPLDRATGILKLAINAAHAKYNLEGNQGDPPVFTPTFKAKLALHNAARIGDLNVDTAEDVEAWLQNEIQTS